jgi:hypothetical protein
VATPPELVYTSSNYMRSMQTRMALGMMLGCVISRGLVLFDLFGTTGMDNQEQ